MHIFLEDEGFRVLGTILTHTQTSEVGLPLKPPAMLLARRTSERKQTGSSLLIPETSVSRVNGVPENFSGLFSRPETDISFYHVEGRENPLDTNTDRRTSIPGVDVILLLSVYGPIIL